MPNVIFEPYRQVPAKMLNKEVNWSGDAITITQHTSAYTPNLDTDTYVSNLTGEVATGGGYTQGGVVLSGRSVNYVAANAWTSQWAAATAYVAGQIVRPTVGNGLIYRCSVAGTSSASQPTWPTVPGLSVVDGGVTWTCIGSGAVRLVANAVQWLSYTATLRYLVISDRTSGTAATQPLIALGDLGTSQTGGGGNFDLTFDSNGVLVLPTF